MLKNFLVLFISALALFRIETLPVLAQDTGWEITSFNSHITINSDTSVEVIETIAVDFHDLDKHGIFRTIPVKYLTRWGNNLDIKFDLISVTDPAGENYQVETTRAGKNIQLKIGDPDKLITGENIYLISYQINRVVTTPDATAEFYWNATGNDWPVPILKAQATVTGPDNSLTDTICFKDYFGQSFQDCTAGLENSTAQFTTSNIQPGQGLTVAVALDKAQLSFPTTTTQIIWFLQDNWLYGLPLVTLAAMLYLYWTRGRDKQYRHFFSQTEGGEIVPLFQKLHIPNIYAPPKDLSP